MAEETTYVGKCNFRGNQRVFGIKQKDRRQHLYVIGKTGTGKTALLKNLALQDIRSGHGVCIIDPHGEFVEEVTEQIPPERINDVVYFNPVDSEYPIGFNVLEVPDMKYKHLVVSDLLGIFTKIWANVWSARMEYILQNCILALLDTPGTTLLGIPRILTDKDYRQRIVARVTDPVVKSFWVHEFETWRDQFRNEAIVPIQNKVGQFLNTPFIRNIVGQPTSSLRIPDIMNEGKVLLVNVSKGRIGEDNSALLGAMIITKVQLASMERVRIPEEDRRDFYLYVDEFQNFATDSFAAILSEARKYRLNIIIAHQYVGQLVTDVSKSTKVKDAVFGNVGTMISFRVGAIDAEFLEKEFFPEFTQNDIINLPNYHVYLKLMVDGVTSRPFSAVTLPPLKFEIDPSAKEKIVNVSRELYGRPRAEVEEKITRWSSGIGEDASEYGAGVAAGGIAAAGPHEAVCWNCGKKTTIPFKPDGKRPVYCQTCYKQIEEGRLVPIHERMPQVGREKFSASLGDLGIEFQAGAGISPSRSGIPASQAGQGARGGSLPSRDSGTFRPVSPTRSDSSEMRRELHQGERDEGPRQGGSPSARPRYQERQFGPPRPQFRDERRESRPAPAGIRSQSVIRSTSSSARPISLSALRSPADSQQKSSPSTQERNTAKRERTSVDVSALRKILDESLKDAHKEDDKKTAPKNGGSTLKPGESIKL